MQGFAFYKKKFLTILLSSAAIVPLTATPSISQNFWDSRLFIMDKCIYNDIPQELVASAVAGEEDKEFLGALVGSLLSAVIPRVIDAGVELTSRALEQAASDKVETTQAKAALNGFYRPDTAGNVIPSLNTKCLIFTRGDFGTTREAGQLTGKPWNTLRGKAFLEKSGLSSDPGIYWEGWVSFSPDQTSMRLVPSHFQYNVRLADPRQGLNNDAESDVIVEIKFQSPNSTGAFASAVFQYLAMGRPSRVTKSASTGLTSRWLGIAPSSGIATATFNKIEALKVELNTVTSALQNSNNPAPSSGTENKLREELAVLTTKIEELTISSDANVSTAFTDGSPETTTKSNETEMEAARRKHKALVYKKQQELALLAAKAEAAVKNSQIAVLNAIEDNLLKEKLIREELAEYSKLNLVPFDIEFIFRETTAGSKILKQISEVLNASKPSLKEAFSLHLDPAQESDRIQSNISEDKTLLTAQQAKLLAEITTREYDALDQNISERDRYERLLELQNAQAGANEAALVAGLPKPYPSIRKQ